MPLRLAGYQHFVLLALLAVFSLTVIERPDSVFGRLLWLVDVGLFFLWQPIVSADRRLTVWQVLVVFALVFVFALKLSWSGLAAWGIFVAALVGGKVIVTRQRRLGWYYLLAFAFLVLVVFTWISPQLFDVGQGGHATLPATWVPMMNMALLATVAVVAPWGRLRHDAGVYDFLISLLILLILSFVLMLTNGVMLVYRLSHLEALTGALLSLGAVVLLLSWAWNPRLGFSGLGALASRYLLRLGFPFEDWLRHISDAFDREDRPERFLQASVLSFAELPWVVGGVARREGREVARFGQVDRHEVTLSYEGVEVRLYTAYHWTAALVWQANLLLKLVADFYFAKLREQQLQQMRYLEAVHETGSRVTHDVKNLLQTLEGLCFAVSKADEDPREAADLMRRQLPVVTRRLRLTLEKLSEPEADDTVEVLLSEWWHAVQDRYSGQDIGFAFSGSEAGVNIPAAMFDNVIDNLLSNALQKQAADPGVRISVSLDAGDEGGVMRVEDTGERIPDYIEARLFSGPARSANGLGVGLLHAFRLAARKGYRLALASNRPGSVVFVLARA